MASRVYVCSLFDTVAKEHGPLFHAKNFALAQRAVRGFLQQATNVRPDDFVVRVHGSFDLEAPDGAWDVSGEFVGFYDSAMQALGSELMLEFIHE